MASNYPSSLDTATEQPSPSATDEMDDVGLEHDVVHSNASEAILALEAKLGVGATTAAAASTDEILVKQSDGDTEWVTNPAKTSAATASADGYMTSAYASKLDGIEASATADQTAADIRGLGFFDTSNDGASSGLDADLLDGQHGSYYAPADLSVNAQTGTSYSLVAADGGKVVTLSNSGAITLTVPTNASQALPVGTQILLVQKGAGQVTIAAAGGVTVNATPGLKISAQHAAAALVKLATDEWVAIGSLAA